MDVINLINPDDAKFGILSNHADISLTIDGERWKTVTNYIYASILASPECRSKIQQASVDSIQELFDECNKEI